MPESAFDELTAALRLSLRDLSPDFTTDVDDKGGDVLLVTIRNPAHPYWGVSYEAAADRDGRITGALWFGQCEVTGHLPGGDAAAAIRSVTSGEIIAVVRYKSLDDLDDRHPSGWQRVLQVIPGSGGADDDTAAYEVLMRRLRTPPTLRDRLDRKTVGVFEVARFDDVTVIERLKSVKK